MRFIRSIMVLTILLAVVSVMTGQERGTAGQRGAGERGAAPAPQRGGGGGGGGRRGIQIMTLSSPAWPSGGTIPRKYTQAGEQVSPPLNWTGAPEGTVSFVLFVRDLDAPTGDGLTTEILHWMLWNIPGTATGLPEGLQQGFQLPDGTRQISVSGPYYRGPGAPAADPAHHYVFELFALDSMINVTPTSQAPGIQVVNMTRANVLLAMAGHVRGKAVLVGQFRRSS